MELTNLEKLAEQYYQDMKMQDLNLSGQHVGIPRTYKEREAQCEGFKDGFKMCEEIKQNKLFTKNDMIKFAYFLYKMNNSCDEDFAKDATFLIEDYESDEEYHVVRDINNKTKIIITK